MQIKKILVSQPQPSSDKSPYYDIARRHGVEIVFRPLIKVESLTSKEFRQSKINLSEYTAVIFTAKTAVDNYFHLCEQMRFEVPDTMKYFCTTESIALYLQKYIVYRKRKIFFGLNGRLNDPQLLAAISKHNKEKALFPVSDVHKGEKEPDLDATKISYTKAVMFRTVSNDFGPDEAFDYDLLIFFSPSGIQALKKNFPDFSQEQSGIYIGCLGAQTAKAVTDAGLRLDFTAPRPGAPSITAALDLFLEEKSAPAHND